VKFLPATISGVLGLGLNCSALQGDFLNLDFNSPDLSKVVRSVPYPYGTVADLLSWQIDVLSPLVFMRFNSGEPVFSPLSALAADKRRTI
jgi:hypothetical protein